MTFQELLDDERALGREEGIGIGREEGIGEGIAAMIKWLRNTMYRKMKLSNS